MRPLPRALLVAAVAFASLPAPGAAHTCGEPDGVTGWVHVAAVDHRVAGRVNGLELGAGATLPVAAGALSVGGHRARLSGAPAAPVTLRAAFRRPVTEVAEWQVCGAAHAAASWFSADAGSGHVLVGGPGIQLSRPIRLGDAMVVPHIEARGLAARAAGTVLDEDVDGTGLSLGVEAGALAWRGRWTVLARASLDGFAPGLGATPYPARAVRLGLGYRF